MLKPVVFPSGLHFWEILSFSSSQEENILHLFSFLKDMSSRRLVFLSQGLGIVLSIALEQGVLHLYSPSLSVVTSLASLSSHSFFQNNGMGGGL